MEIIVDLTREDYADLNRYVFLKKGLVKRLYIVIAVAIVLPLVATLGTPLNLKSYLTYVIVTFLGFGIFYLGIIMIVVNRTGRLPSRDGSILGKKKITITDEALICESENNTTVQKWKGIKEITGSKKSIFLFIDKMAAFVIPRRCFRNEAQQREFLSIIEQKVKNTN